MSLALTTEVPTKDSSSSSLLVQHSISAVVW